MAEARIYAGLDIGTTKITAIVAEPEEDGEGIRIVGVGTAPSDGLKRGVVVNLEKTTRSIQYAVQEAERMSGRTIRSVFTGIAGDHIRGINSRGVIAVSRKDAEIRPHDLERVIEAAKAVAIPADREILHVLPQEFIVDDQDGIRDPVGMSGVRLEAEVHIITGAASACRNVIRAAERAGLQVEELVLEPLASADAVLTQDERDLGVALMDIGGGTTDLAIFYEGSVRHTAVIGLGGANVTNDLAIGLRTPVERAEQLKLQSGCALTSMVSPKEVVQVPSVGGRMDREVSRHMLAMMIEPRIEEIFELGKKEIRTNHIADLLGAGLVLTGGASSLMGMPELAEQVFDLPVRRGFPMGITGLTEAVCDPRYATGVGLAIHAHLTDARPHTAERGVFGRISFGLKRWIEELV
ncbi:MAG: cell division protein FtsA [Candidatus Eisenbacteria bacterium]|uniref:Cell division protein FtsA n=1 Tax=Eiseniibacteriota bacterium TaxID=2212470 RepID=A0A538T877_UNCEI|nr:MAG: cell division protein FtsA [Candidatus Eisenbacteria bacterium]